MEALIIKDKTGERAVEVIVAGQRTVAEGQNTSTEGELNTSDALGSKLESDIKRMVIEETDKANPERLDEIAEDNNLADDIADPNLS